MTDQEVAELLELRTELGDAERARAEKALRRPLKPEELRLLVYLRRSSGRQGRVNVILAGDAGQVVFTNNADQLGIEESSNA